jgi:penicillin-binding protein 1C
MFRKTFRFLKRYRFAVITVLLLLFIAYWNCLPEKLFNDPHSTVLDDRRGELLSAQIASDGQWRFPENNKVPRRFAQCIVQFEDRYFYSHPGFSLRAFARACRQNISAGRVVSGGSTITMQLVRLMRRNKGRTVFEKAVEIILATRIELSYSKKEILAMYTSHAPFGGNVVGLDAAAWRYFGRPADQLSWSESATLAVLPNAPGLIYPGRNQRDLLAKRNRLLKRLHTQGLLDEKSLMLAQKEPLPGKPHPLPQLATHLLERANAEGYSNRRLKTTIERSMQEHVLKMTELHHRQLSENGVHNAAAIVISVKSGEVIAYVGNTPDVTNEHGGDVDLVKAPRSTGSILKPFLYASMMDAGRIMPGTLISDIPTQISGYAPQNNNQAFDGAVPAWRALARSLNVPAVRMLSEYGVEKFEKQLKDLGITTLKYPASHYGLSLILGGGEANLWDLASVYASMARTLNSYPDYAPGFYGKPVYFHPLTDKKKEVTDGGKIAPPLSPSSIWFTFEAMLEVTRPEEEINWKSFSSSRKIAWKTGTSFGNRDAWAIGVTPDFVVAVWAGNADGEGRHGLTGISSAAPLLFDIFARLPGNSWFRQPFEDMARVSQCRMSGHRASTLCEITDTAWVPLSSLHTTACPYHQVIHLDRSKKWRVASDCEEVSSMKHVAWFVLPPLVEKYYRFNHPDYKPLPEFKAGCIGKSTERPMAVIYPKKPSKIYLPVQFDGTTGKAVFEVTHRKQDVAIYWHLDEQFLGTTSDIHQMEMSPSTGKHMLNLTDENGNSLSQSFEVMGKEQ